MKMDSLKVVISLVYTILYYNAGRRLQPRHTAGVHRPAPLQRRAGDQGRAVYICLSLSLSLIYIYIYVCICIYIYI